MYAVGLAMIGTPLPVGEYRENLHAVLRGSGGGGSSPTISHPPP